MMELLTRRQVEVATAAGPVFLANGFAQTTMGALAAAAGLSRQGLYLLFPHKEAVFTAAVHVLNERLHAEVRGALETCSGLEARLGLVCERWAAGVYDLQQSTPQAKDMDDLSFPVVREVYQRFVELAASLLREGREDRLPMAAAQDLACVLVFAVRGLFAIASDGAALRRLMALQVAGVAGTADRFSNKSID